jgi:hypothetical protein
MAPFLEFGLLVSWSRAEYNLVLCWINQNLPRTQGDFRYRRRRQDQWEPATTAKSAWRKQLTVALSSPAAEAESDRLRSNRCWACSCAGSARPRELSAALPTRANLRLRALMKAPVIGADRNCRRSCTTPRRLHPTMKIHPQKSASGPMAAVFKRGRRRRNGSGIYVGEHSNERQ